MPFELPSELLSGPDLGGGFLFQLTREVLPAPGTFTFHAQEGGTDAAQAPAGSPGSIGFERPATPCMYGGNGCWHLVLPLPEGERSAVRVAYNRTRFVIDPMLSQAAHVRDAPIDAAMRELLGRIVTPLRDSGIAWQIGGSAAAWLRGIDLAPGDIDLGVDEPATPRLAELIQEYLVVPNHRGPTYLGRTRGAAFLGTLKSGMRVEWGGASTAGTPDGRLSEWDGPGWTRRVATVTWEGFPVPVAPIEFEIVRLAERAQSARLDALLGSPKLGPIDRPLLAQLFAESTATPDLRSHVDRELE
jgi:hypothetical protein